MGAIPALSVAITVALHTGAFAMAASFSASASSALPSMAASFCLFSNPISK
jgi:hypothetical protein